MNVNLIKINYIYKSIYKNLNLNHSFPIIQKLLSYIL